MEPSEEQSAELEALEAIFGDDYRLLEQASADRGARFDIQIAREASSTARLKLCFEHPVDYPASRIIVTVHAVSGLSTVKRKSLQEVADRLADENVGFPSAFNVCEGLNDWMHQNLDDGHDATSDTSLDEEAFETRDTKSAGVEVDASKCIGTPVTPESFAAWREKFMEELQQRKTEQQRGMEMTIKPTGRQLFEQSKEVISEESDRLWEMEADLYEDGDEYYEEDED